MIYVIYKWIKKIKDRTRYLSDIKKYNDLNTTGKFPILRYNLRPYYDWNSEAASLDAHYFLQDLYMARKVLENKATSCHYDIGSRIDGFIAHLLTVVEVTQIDIRPLSFEVEGLHFFGGDATSLTMLNDGEIESISCLHALEHMGLGRYGDSIDPRAYIKALHEIKRVLKVGGRFYLSVPIGDEEKVCFNAHRIFNPMTIIEELRDMKLLEFSYINNYKINRCDPEDKNEYGSYSCGMFIFEKL